MHIICELKKDAVENPEASYNGELVLPSTWEVIANGTLNLRCVSLVVSL